MHLNVDTGVSYHMTFWESLAFLRCVLTLSEWFREYPVLLVGENTGPLQNSLDLDGDMCPPCSVERTRMGTSDVHMGI